MSAFFFQKIGPLTPYPFISAIGLGLYILGLTFGLYFVVNRLDGKIEREHVKNGYKLLVAVANMSALRAVLLLAKADFGSLVINSGAIMLFQKATLSVVVPLCKKCFGDNDLKLWSYGVPSIVFSLELGQCVLFLRTELGGEFVSLLIVQESNSVAKNTGLYNEVQAVVRGWVGRPIEESVRKAMEERRAIIAPCDNIGEILSPVVLMVTIGLEILFDVIPGTQRAPYLSRSGILGAWRRVGEETWGGMLRLLTIVLAVRIFFCWIEIKVRQYQSRNRHLDDHHAPSEGVAQHGGGDSSAHPNTSSRSRRSSMQVLFNRIVHSTEAPMRIRYLAVSLFCLQAVLLVCNAANIGREGKS